MKKLLFLWLFFPYLLLAVTYTGVGSAETLKLAREQAKKAVAKSIMKAIKDKYRKDGFPRYFNSQEELKATLQIYGLLDVLKVNFTRPLFRNVSIATKAYVRDINIVNYIEDIKEKFNNLSENIGREQLTDMIISLEQADYLIKSVDFTDIQQTQDFLQSGIKKMQIYRTHPSIVLDFNISDKQVYLDERAVEANRIYVNSLVKHTISVQKEGFHDYNQSFILSNTSIKTISPLFVAKKKFALHIEADPIYLIGLKRFFEKYQVELTTDSEYLVRVHFFEDAYNKLGAVRKVSMRVDSILEKNYQELYRTFTIIKEYCPLDGCNDSSIKSQAIEQVVLKILNFLSHASKDVLENNESTQPLAPQASTKEQMKPKKMDEDKTIKKPKSSALKLEMPSDKEREDNEVQDDSEITLSDEEVEEMYKQEEMEAKKEKQEEPVKKETTDTKKEASSLL